MLKSLLVKKANGTTQEYRFAKCTCIIGSESWKVKLFLDVLEHLAINRLKFHYWHLYNSTIRSHFKDAVETLWGKGSVIKLKDYKPFTGSKEEGLFDRESAREILDGTSHEYECFYIIPDVEWKLNPNEQREAVSRLKLRLPESQLILTTNSPTVVKSLHSWELLDFDAQDKPEAPFTDAAFPNFDFYVEDLSTEEILENVFHVEKPQHSKMYLEFYNAAYEYFQLVNKLKNSPDKSLEEKKEEALKRFNSILYKFKGSKNPAFDAYFNVDAYLAAIEMKSLVAGFNVTSD